jgi:hypothetical protein
VGFWNIKFNFYGGFFFWGGHERGCGNIFWKTRDKIYSETKFGKRLAEKMSNRKTLKLHKGTSREKIIEYPRTFPRPYTIKAYSRKRARELGVRIQVSTNPEKKLDVFSKKGEKLASIGAAGMGDYPTFRGVNRELGEWKRKHYKMRHEKDRHVVGTPGYFADKILW